MIACSLLTNPSLLCDKTVKIWLSKVWRKR